MVKQPWTPGTMTLTRWVQYDKLSLDIDSPPFPKFNWYNYAQGPMKHAWKYSRRCWWLTEQFKLWVWSQMAVLENNLTQTASLKFDSLDTMICRWGIQQSCSMGMWESLASFSLPSWDGASRAKQHWSKLGVHMVSRVIDHLSPWSSNYRPPDRLILDS